MNEHVPNPKAAEANIEQLVADIADSAGVMIAQLTAAIRLDLRSSPVARLLVGYRRFCG